jgi:hypothetical protein
MSKIVLHPVDHPEVAPQVISPRLRSQLVYFMASPGKAGVPELAEGEFWFDKAEVDTWVQEGVFYLISPLDTANQTEVELTEEQEVLLNWLHKNQVEHVRVTE